MFQTNEQRKKKKKERGESIDQALFIQFVDHVEHALMDILQLHQGRLGCFVPEM